MNHIKRLLIFTVAMIASASLYTASAADNVGKFLEKISSNAISFDYVFSVDQKGGMEGDGNVVVNGDRFKMVGNGIEIRCDGKTRWTIDREGKEVIIESVNGSEVANPTLLIANVDSKFKLESKSSVTFNGKKASKAVFIPKTDTELVELVLYITGDSNLIGAEMLFNKGSRTKLTINNFKTISKDKLTESFSMSKGSFDSSFIITDLR